MTTEKRTLTPEQATEQLKTLINGSLNRSYDLESVMKLVRLGADPNTKSANGQSLLHILTMRKNNVARVNNRAIKELVKGYKANIELQDSKGCTPLQCLMNNDFLAEEAMDLIRLGADPNTKSNNGKSLLHILTQNREHEHHEEDEYYYAEAEYEFFSDLIRRPGEKFYAYVTFHNTIQELVSKYKADINIQDAKGYTPLHYLIDKRCFHSALRLVRLGANPNIVSDQGSFLYLLLVHPRFWVCIETLIKKYRANIEIQDAEGYTPLQRLIDDGEYRKGIPLVRLGANPNTQSKKSGRSLLHEMMRWIDHSNWPVEELVKTYGANINIEDAAGLTPLQHLMHYPFETKSAMQLIRLGANPFVKGKWYTCPLLERLSALSSGTDPYIPELRQAIINFSDKLRSNFLNLLFLLSCYKNDQSSNSLLKKLPIEHLCLILSFVDFGEMGKTLQERDSLAHTILSQPQIIKEMAQTEGGINVLQRNNQETGVPTFVFFKSTQNSSPCNQPEIQSQLKV